MLITANDDNEEYQIWFSHFSCQIWSHVVEFSGLRPQGLKQEVRVGNKQATPWIFECLRGQFF